MSYQLSPYFEKIVSKFQCDFGKGFSTQRCLHLMLEKWKYAVDNKNVFGALLRDLSKTFVCICPDLLIAKLNAYGLSLPALKLVHNNLQNRKKEQRMVLPTAYGVFQEFHKDRSWAHSYLTYFSAIYF